MGHAVAVVVDRIPVGVGSPDLLPVIDNFSAADGLTVTTRWQRVHGALGPTNVHRVSLDPPTEPSDTTRSSSGLFGGSCIRVLFFMA